MPQDPACTQLLTLIGARSQQWLRNQIGRLAQADDGTTAALAEYLPEIACAARVCSELRGSKVPLETFIGGHLTSDMIARFLTAFQDASESSGSCCRAFMRFLPRDLRDRVVLTGRLPLTARLAMTDEPDRHLLQEVEAVLRRPVADEDLDDHIIASFCELLALSYDFGTRRARFSHPRVYGEAFANCLRFADWAQRRARLLPLVQMVYGLCLIDPDFDAMPMLSDVIASQRPDGSFPARIGFGTADQDLAALRPTLGTLVALHVVLHGHRHAPTPLVPLAA